MRKLQEHLFWEQFCCYWWNLPIGQGMRLAESNLWHLSGSFRFQKCYAGRFSDCSLLCWRKYWSGRKSLGKTGTTQLEPPGTGSSSKNQHLWVPLQSLHHCGAVRTTRIHPWVSLSCAALKHSKGRNYVCGLGNSMHHEHSPRHGSWVTTEARWIGLRKEKLATICKRTYSSGFVSVPPTPCTPSHQLWHMLLNPLCMIAVSTFPDLQCPLKTPTCLKFYKPGPELSIVRTWKATGILKKLARNKKKKRKKKKKKNHYQIRGHS